MSTRNRLKKLRTKARRHLPALLKAQGGLCRWCRRPIVYLPEIQANYQVVTLTGNFVRWREAGTVYQAHIATTDHLIPVRDGGSNDPRNLCAACGPCNRDRTDQDPRRMHRCRCDGCGGRRDQHGRLCRLCVFWEVHAYLTSYDWDYWPDGPLGDGRWQSPGKKTLHDTRNALRICRRYYDYRPDRTVCPVV